MKNKNKNKINGNAKQSTAITKVTMAAASSSVTKQKVPKIDSASNGLTVSHSEFMFDVTSSLTAKGYDVNPQKSSIFTWLPAIAGRFELYRFKKLIFRYTPSVGTSKDGFVSIGFDFDVQDGAPSKAAIMSWSCSARSPAWSACSINASSDSRVSTRRYCNSGTLGTGDPRLNDIGKFWIIATAGTTGDELGEMYCDYTVEFYQMALKIPPALYADGRKASAEKNNYFSNYLNNWEFSGNMDILQDTVGVVINSVGKYLIEVATEQTGSDYVNIVAQAVAGNPVGEWVLNEVQETYGGGGQNTTGTLEVLVPPVLLRAFAEGLPGGATEAFARIATYVASDTRRAINNV